MDATQELLIDELKNYSISCTPDQATLLLKHLDLVIEKNRDLNLTRIDSVEDGIYLHIIDSLLASPLLMPCSQTVRILDLGTGGGYPGIPLAIHTGAQVTMIDSVQKKAHAVDEFVSKLGLSESCEVLPLRSEDVAKQNPESFDNVVARAVAQTNVLIEYAAPLLKTGGALVALKAQTSHEEIETASRAAELCGMEIVSRETFELPKAYGSREIIYIRKNTEPKIKLPRRPGMATKRPLGL